MPRTVKWRSPHLTKNQKEKLKRISNITDAEEKKIYFCRILLVRAELIKSAVQSALDHFKFIVVVYNSIMVLALIKHYYADNG